LFLHCQICKPYNVSQDSENTVWPDRAL
jgi:hypothetical protein